MNDTDFAEEMRKYAKQMLERFPGLAPVMGVVDERPHSKEEYLLSWVKQFEDDASTEKKP